MDVLEQLKSIKELSQIPPSYRDHWSCGVTAQIILKYLRRRKTVIVRNTNILMIDDELLKEGLCYVHLENGNIDEMYDIKEINNVFAHVFIIYKIENDIYRLDSYIETYPFRITKWNTYKEDILTLLESKPGNTRLNLWNSIFDCNESEDTNQKMYMELRRQV